VEALFIALTVLVVAGIGLVSVGGVTARLAAAPPRTLFDLDEAVDFVADRLPPHAAGQLSYDDLRLVLGWHLDYLEARGVATEADDGTGPPATAPGGAGDEPSGGPVAAPAPATVADEDDGVAFVLGRAADAGVDVDDVAIVEVIEVEAAYLAAIGALGDRVGDRPEAGG
jgi:hypothetical protein